MTARTLLASVLREARYMLDRSPEQIALAVGLSARTVRRLEDPSEPRRPRSMTLRPLANFYGLDHPFLEQLVLWGDMEGSALRTALRERTFELLTEAEAGDLEDAPDELRLLALRAARGAGSGGRATPIEGLTQGLLQTMQGVVRTLAADEHDALAELVDRFGQLDRRRRRMLVALAADLQAGRDRELGL